VTRRNDRNRARRRKAWPKRRAIARAAYWAHCEARHSLSFQEDALRIASTRPDRGSVLDHHKRYTNALCRERDAKRWYTYTFQIAQSSRLAFRKDPVKQ
jgi:hypothetical protein